MNEESERREADGMDALFPSGHARLSGMASGSVTCECGERFGSHVGYNVHISGVVRQRRREGYPRRLVADEVDGEAAKEEKAGRNAGERGGNGRS